MRVGKCICHLYRSFHTLLLSFSAQLFSYASNALLRITNVFFFCLSVNRNIFTATRQCDHASLWHVLAKHDAKQTTSSRTACCCGEKMLFDVVIAASCCCILLLLQILLANCCCNCTNNNNNELGVVVCRVHADILS